MSVVFWGCAALVAFTYAGYPVWVRVWATLRPKPVARADVTPTVTAILCVHDGEARVGAKLHNLLAMAYPAALLDVVVACDGCTDNSAEACRTVGSPRVRVLEFDQRRGKAACLNDAVSVATGDILLMVDVRQRIEEEALGALVACLADPAVGAVGGELRFEHPDTGFAASVDAYWRYEKAIRQAESRSGSVVGVSGALYAVRRELFRPIPEGTVLDDVLVPMQVVRAHRRVVFEPGARAWDHASASAGDERVRKVRTLAGNLQLVQLAPWLVNPLQNPIWFRFLCHKLLRLVAPWAMVLMLLAACLLASKHPFYLACLVAAGLVIVVVAVAPALPRLAAWWPVRMLVAFVHMNLYSAQATVAFVRRRTLHLW
ncbi:glycosyltransferase family 2 protein [Novilysobacter antarcticus]|uniref:glycosyltransferase family 2 protein n=1 Tax=Novilysobacter antarcticus TaxID=2862543 RepID=UPI001C9A15CF|nr:glycosyltransferase family 2 protein [Lysobacter antarcticus]